MTNQRSVSREIKLILSAVIIILLILAIIYFIQYERTAKNNKFISLPSSVSQVKEITLIQYNNKDTKTQSIMLSGNSMDKIIKAINNSKKHINKNHKGGCSATATGLHYTYDIIVHYSGHVRVFSYDSICNELIDGNRNLLINPPNFPDLQQYFK